MKFITITEPVVSKDKLFKRKEQYCYIDRIMMDVTCPLCQEQYKNKLLLHYRLFIDGEYYYIPEYAVVKLDYVYKDYEKDIYISIEQENIQPKDFIKTFKEVTGRDIDNTYKADRNIALEKALINFSSYGVADPQKAINTQNKLKEKRLPLPICNTEKDIIHDALFVSFEKEELLFCGETTTVTLEPKITGLMDRYSILWNTGDRTPTITITLNPGDRYEYIVSVTDDVGCIKTAKITVAVEHYGSFDESFDCSYDIGCLKCD